MKINVHSLVLIGLFVVYLGFIGYYFYENFYDSRSPYVKEDYRFKHYNRTIIKEVNKSSEHLMEKCYSDYGDVMVFDFKKDKVVLLVSKEVVLVYNDSFVYAFEPYNDDFVYKGVVAKDVNYKDFINNIDVLCNEADKDYEKIKGMVYMLVNKVESYSSFKIPHSLDILKVFKDRGFLGEKSDFLP